MTLALQLPPLPEVEKIAVLRANAVGDFLFALPALVEVADVLAAAEDLAFGGQSARPRPARISARRSRSAASASSGA